MLRKVRLEPNQHCFTRGFQHRISKPWVCPNATWVTFLGNQQAKRCATLFLTQLYYPFALAFHKRSADGIPTGALGC